MLVSSPAPNQVSRRGQNPMFDLTLNRTPDLTLSLGSNRIPDLSLEASRIPSLLTLILDPKLVPNRTPGLTLSLGSNRIPDLSLDSNLVPNRFPALCLDQTL